MQLSYVGERSSVLLRWLDVSLSVRQTWALSSARHLTEVLLADSRQKMRKKKQVILAAISMYMPNTGMPEIILVQHRHFFSGSHLCQSGIGLPASGSACMVPLDWSRISPALQSFANFCRHSMRLSFSSDFYFRMGGGWGRERV